MLFFAGWLYELWIKSRDLSGEVGLVRASLIFRVAPLAIADAAACPIVLLCKTEVVVE
jgi:hypothetical protein